MLNQETDCEACRMPQELRWPQNRTEYVDEEIIKFLNLNAVLPTYARRGLTELAFLINWGDIEETDLELLNIGFLTVDEVQANMMREKTQTKGSMKIKDIFSNV